MGEKFPKYEISVYEDKTSTIGGANVVSMTVKAPKLKECKKLYDYVKKTSKSHLLPTHR